MPMVPGVFNDGGVEEAKRNLRLLPAPDGMTPPRDPNAPPVDPGFTPSRFPGSNPLRGALSASDEIAPEYKPGGDVSPTTNLPSIPISARSDRRPSRDRNLIDPTTRESDYQSQLEEYKPQNEGMGKTALRMALGFFGAGPTGTIAPLLNRKRSDENWRRGEIARSEDKQDRGNLLRRATLGEDLTRSQIAENTAQANRDSTKYDWFPQDTNGDGIADTETYQPIKPGASKRVFRKTAAEGNPMVVETKNADGSTTRKLSFDHGKTWEVAEGLGDAPPVAKPDKPTADFSKRSTWYYKKQSEAESQAQDLRQQAAAADTTTYAGQKQQEDLLKRAGEAEKNALTYRDKGDEAATEPTARSGGASTSAPSPATHVLSKAAWLASHPGQESEWPKAVAAAKAAKYQVID